jgi:hypothetical protein
MACIATAGKPACPTVAPVDPSGATAMTKSAANLLPIDEESDAASTQAPKTRTCLRCQAKFQSEWAGERICTRCKGTSAWRAGTPMPGSSTRMR